MKLTDLKQLQEGRVDPNVKLSLQHLIQQKGVKPNVYQLIVVARLVNELKSGTFYKNNNFYEYLGLGDKGLLDQLRAMEGADLLALATKLNELIEIKDQDVLYSLVNPTQEAIAWIKWVTSREAND